MTTPNIPNRVARLTKAQRKAILTCPDGLVCYLVIGKIMRLNLFRAGMLEYVPGVTVADLCIHLTPLGEDVRAYLIAQDNEQ